MTEPRHHASDPDETTRIPADALADLRKEPRERDAAAGGRESAGRESAGRESAGRESAGRAANGGERGDGRGSVGPAARPEAAARGDEPPGLARRPDRPGSGAGGPGAPGAVAHPAAPGSPGRLGPPAAGASAAGPTAPTGRSSRPEAERRESSFAARYVDPGYASGTPAEGTPSGQNGAAQRGFGPAGPPSGPVPAAGFPGSGHDRPASPERPVTPSGQPRPAPPAPTGRDEIFGGHAGGRAEASLDSLRPGAYGSSGYGSVGADTWGGATAYAGSFPGTGYPGETTPSAYGSGSALPRDPDITTTLGGGTATGLGTGAGVGTGPFVGGSTLGTSPSRTGSRATRGRAAAPGRPARRARLLVRHVDPWSTFKFSLVLSVALFFVWLIAIGVLYGVLNGIGVFDRINNLYDELSGSTGGKIVTPGLVLGMAALVGAVNIVLMTALATIGSFIYNICSDLVGGIEVTLAERD